MTDVLVQTLDIRHGNYGGCLQAFALRQALENFGYNATTALKRRHYKIFGIPVNVGFYRFVNHLLPPRLIRTRYVHESNTWHFDDFIQRNMRTIEISFPPTPQDIKLLRKFDVFLAGSDQIWRPPYADIPFYLFNYITSPEKTLLSYAASFGRDDFTAKELDTIREARHLASKFSGISVREESGIGICQEQWGKEAVQIIDPTFLLTKDDYRAIIMGGEVTDLFTEPGVFSYVLDSSDSTDSSVLAVCQELGLSPSSLISHPSDVVAAKLVSQLVVKRMPSLEQWLNNIDTANFIVTDSFHGCCFAILFNKPFIALGNAARGQTRFTSLLKVFNLQHRLVGDVSEITPELVHQPIDWGSVNSRINAERNRGIAFLTKHVGNADVSHN